MFLKFRITCRCNCSYTISESICTDKVICPNCGTAHPYSDKLILMLKTASEIQIEHKDVFDKSFNVSVVNTISPWDEALHSKESGVS